MNIKTATSTRAGPVPNRDRKIIDGFIFFNELALLNMRLHELDDTVDFFVIVESRITHSGNPKPLHFELNKAHFRQFLPKIVHHVIDGRPRPANLWRRFFPHRNAIEFHHRAAIQDAVQLVPGLSPDDIVLFSDVDEIPNPAYLRRDRFNGENVIVFNQRYFFYDLGCENLRGWPGTIGMTYHQFAYADLNKLRKSENRAKDSRIINVPEVAVRECHAGWHCSNFGGVERIATKLESSSHQKYNQDRYKDRKVLADNIRNRRDWLQRDEPEHVLQPNDEASDKFLPRFRHLAYQDPGIDQSLLSAHRNRTAI